MSAPLPFEERRFVYVPTKNRAGRQVAELIKIDDGKAFIRRWESTSMSGAGKFSTSHVPESLILGAVDAGDVRLPHVRVAVESEIADDAAKKQRQVEARKKVAAR